MSFDLEVLAKNEKSDGKNASQPFNFSLHRSLRNNVLTGTIPSEISMLTNLNYVYAPSLIKMIECLVMFLLSVALTSFLMSVGQSRLHFSFN